MTSYHLTTPDWLWEAYKETVSQAETLDEPLHEEMARRVAEHDLVDQETRARAASFIEAEEVDGWR